MGWLKPETFVRSAKHLAKGKRILVESFERSRPLESSGFFTALTMSAKQKLEPKLSTIHDAVAWTYAPTAEGCETVGAMAFLGPRLRATRTRMRSIISAGEQAPLGRKTSAWRARSKALTVPDTIIAGRPG